MSPTETARTVSLASGSFLHEMAMLKVMTSSGMPLLSSSTFCGGSQASPRPSWSLSVCRMAPASVDGLEMVGQLSTASVTPSASRSSSTVPQDPLLATPSLLQVSCTMLTQVFPVPWHWLSAVQVLVGVRLQCPLTGHCGSVVQRVVGVLSHDPKARTTLWGLTQSPSQASPMWSPSLSICGAGFGVRTQLSKRSLTPSLSLSLPDESQAAPWPAFP